MPLSLSTSWFARRFDRAEELSTALTPTGFHRVEIASGSLGFWPLGLSPAMQRSGMRLVAFEDPFSGQPAGEVGDGRHLGSASDTARARSFERAIRSGEAARAAGCSRVVLHGGWIVPDEEPTHARLLAALDDSPSGDEARAVSERFAGWVKAREVGFLDRLCRTLFELCNREPDITWCLCPGPWPGQLGRLDHLDAIFETVNRKNLAYWHDTASVQMRARLGEGASDAWLDALGRRLEGVYLNDWRGTRAGQPPGIGEIDFQQVRSLLSESTECVLRLGADCDDESARVARMYLEKYHY
ncbi:MAG: TIM barrel protein [Planctomycetota bacterium]